MEYKDMKLPGRAECGKPCGSLILDVDTVLERYHNGISGGASSRRKSLRLSRG